MYIFFFSVNAQRVSQWYLYGSLTPPPPALLRLAEEGCYIPPPWKGGEKTIITIDLMILLTIV